METFKTPKWDSSEICDKKYRNLFGKKQESKHNAKEPTVSGISKNSLTKKKRTKKKKRLKDETKNSKIASEITKSDKPTLKGTNKNNRKSAKIINEMISKDDKQNMKKFKQPSKLLKKMVKESDEAKNGFRNKANEYHTLLKSRKEIMRMSLRERMLERLKSSRFRYINEELYTTEGKLAKNLFKQDPKAFTAYHEGYRQQVNKWPMNPLDTIIRSIKNMPADKIIADMGCGDAKLSQSLQQKVHSFDLQAVNDYVTECEMSNVPLENNSVDIVVFCLSLMGTNIKDFIFEANRILRIGGILKIAEVQSRFEKVDIFMNGVEQFGFKRIWKDLSKDLFYFMDFKKINNCKAKNRLPTISLFPCLYKKR